MFHTAKSVLLLEYEWVCEPQNPTLPTTEDNRIVNIVSRTLERMVSKGNNSAVANDIFSNGDGTVPSISLTDYLLRIKKYSPCDSNVHVTALILIDRVLTKTGITLSIHNVHRLYLTCVVVATKVMEDTTIQCNYSNNLFALIGGIPLEEMNKLELKLLQSLAYSVHVTSDEFRAYFVLVWQKIEKVDWTNRIERIKERRATLERTSGRSEDYSGVKVSSWEITRFPHKWRAKTEQKIPIIAQS